MLDGCVKDTTDEKAEEIPAQAERAPCCPPGAYPQLVKPVDYKPEGKWETFGETKTYVTGDKCWENAIIVIHDVYGPQTGYHYGVCDAFASGGYYVVMPDFYETEGGVDNYWSKDDKAGGATFLQKFSWEFCEKKLEPVYKHLKDAGMKKSAALGFCWGAWVVARMSEDPTKIQAAAWYHPSLWVQKGLFGSGTEDEIIAKVKVPTFFLPSFDEKRDFYDYEKGVAILKENGVASDYYEFSNMHHGWMTRGAGGNGISFLQAGGKEFDVETSSAVNRGIAMGLGFFGKQLFLDVKPTE